MFLEDRPPAGSESWLAALNKQTFTMTFTVYHRPLLFFMHATILLYSSCHRAACACTNKWHSGENAACRTSPGAVPSTEPIGIAGEYAVKGAAEDPRRSV